jgi:CheY-like chemotaxis protein
MGGRIEVRSEKEKGSTFSFVIELRKGQHNEVVPIREEKKNVSLQGVKVLLVEDHEINRLLAFSMLHEWKVTIDIAENGSVAVDKVKNQGYDLILMDMQMPVMSGIEATKVIRKELQSTIPIIALTANASKMDARKYIKAGMNDYITKPFNPVHLFNKIAEHLKIEAGINQGYGHVKPEPVYLYAEPEKLFDLSKLLGMYNGNQEIVSKLVTIFRDNTPLILAQINEHFIHNRLNELAQLAHQLKPSIDFMGISTLSAHIRILEKCQQKTVQERQASMEKLNQVLTLVFQQLAKLKLL